jgi:hypothetical protein
MARGGLSQMAKESSVRMLLLQKIFNQRATRDAETFTVQQWRR